MIKFLFVTLIISGSIGVVMYALTESGTASGAGLSTEQENHFLNDVRQSDSLHIQLKKTDPDKQASQFSALRYREEESIGRMEAGYKADTVFQSLSRTTGRNYSKLLGTVALQASDRQTKADTRLQLVDEVATLKTDIQSLETQLMLKQSSVESMRAMKAAQP